MTPKELAHLAAICEKAVAQPMVYQDAYCTVIPQLIAEVRRCWAALYPHEWPFTDGSGKLVCHFCGKMWDRDGSGYCAERHRRATEGAAE